ncbi:hypothetical protein OF83DRAFT_1087619 [Amylostereum chailletii]|nr:hypothetical protein OF83DRAFT_1087619 [Amylostereum chailletii]
MSLVPTVMMVFNHPASTGCRVTTFIQTSAQDPHQVHLPRLSPAHGRVYGSPRMERPNYYPKDNATLYHDTDRSSAYGHEEDSKLFYSDHSARASMDPTNPMQSNDANKVDIVIHPGQPFSNNPFRGPTEDGKSAPANDSSPHKNAPLVKLEPLAFDSGDYFSTNNNRDQRAQAMNSIVQEGDLCNMNQGQYPHYGEIQDERPMPFPDNGVWRPTQLCASELKVMPNPSSTMHGANTNADIAMPFDPPPSHGIPSSQRALAHHPEQRTDHGQDLSRASRDARRRTPEASTPYTVGSAGRSRFNEHQMPPPQSPRDAFEGPAQQEHGVPRARGKSLQLQEHGDKEISSPRVQLANRESEFNPSSRENRRVPTGRRFSLYHGAYISDRRESQHDSVDQGRSRPTPREQFGQRPAIADGLAVDHVLHPMNQTQPQEGCTASQHVEYPDHPRSGISLRPSSYTNNQLDIPKNLVQDIKGLTDACEHLYQLFATNSTGSGTPFDDTATRVRRIERIVERLDSRLRAKNVTPEDTNEIVKGASVQELVQVIKITCDHILNAISDQQCTRDADQHPINAGRAMTPMTRKVLLFPVTVIRKLASLVGSVFEVCSIFSAKITFPSSSPLERLTQGSSAAGGEYEVLTFVSRRRAIKGGRRGGGRRTEYLT